MWQKSTSQSNILFQGMWCGTMPRVIKVGEGFSAHSNIQIFNIQISNIQGFSAHSQTSQFFISGVFRIARFLIVVHFHFPLHSWRHSTTSSSGQKRHKRWCRNTQKYTKHFKLKITGSIHPGWVPRFKDLLGELQ